MWNTKMTIVLRDTVAHGTVPTSLLKLELQVRIKIYSGQLETLYNHHLAVIVSQRTFCDRRLTVTISRLFNNRRFADSI